MQISVCHSPVRTSYLWFPFGGLSQADRPGSLENRGQQVTDYIHCTPETKVASDCPPQSLDEEDSGDCLCMQDLWGTHLQPWLHTGITKGALKTVGAWVH